MATGQWSTLYDVASRTGSDGKPMVLANYLSQSICVTDDLVMTEANEMGGHEFAFVTSMPGGSWRIANQGVSYSKITTGKSRVALATLEDYSQVDRLVAEQSGNISQFREQGDIYFLEGMGQTLEQTVWYGNSTANPAQFMGLSPFYNTSNTATASNASNVLDAGGTGSSNASLWLICHGQGKFFGLYPRGSAAGLSMVDKGDTVPGFDSLGNRFEAYTSWFRAQLAICPQDWRYIARMANLDVTAAGLAGPNAPDLFALLAHMMFFPPNLGKSTSGITQTDDPRDPNPGVRAVLYCNRTVRHWMDVQAMRNRNVLSRIEDYAGMPVDGFRGIPIKISDQLLNAEARVQ